MEFDAELEVLEIGDHSITWQATDKFQSRRISLSVSPEGSGSRISQVTTAQFHRPPGMARWVYPWLARRTFRTQFANLAAVFAARPGS
jgi:hypothetical protein